MGEEEEMSTDIVLIAIIVTVTAAVCYFWTVNKLLRRTTLKNITVNISEHREFRYDIDLAEGKVARLTGRIEVLEAKGVK
jgi:hypothetical protein